MVKINPLTGLPEEDLQVLESEAGATQSPVNPEGLGTNVGPDTPIKAEGGTIGEEEKTGTIEIIPEEEVEAQTATATDAVVDRGTTEEVETTALEMNRETFLDIQAKQNAGQALTDEEKVLLGRIKAERDTGKTFENIFGEDERTQDNLLSQTDADILNEELGSKPSAEITANLKARGFTDTQIQQVLDRRDVTIAETAARSTAIEQTAEAETLAAQAKARQQEDIQRRTKALQNNTQRLRSLRGVGRGTATEAEILALEEKGQDLIDASNRKINLELDLQKARIEGAEAETISAIRTSLIEAETALQEQLNVNIAETKKLNEQLDADFDKSVDNMLGVLDAAGEDIEGIDREKSKSLGYLVKEDGSIYFNNAGNIVEFKSIGTPTTLSTTDLDNFATSLALGKVKFSDLDLETGDLAKVITAMNTKMDSEPGLSTNRLKAERILKDLGLGTDESSVNTVNNLLKNNSETDVRDMIATDEFKNASFVAGNQKLFDDLRKDADSFKDIDRTFKGMNQIWEDFKDNPSESRAAMEQALIIMFNKMLDPGSVVREGEFDRTSQGQSVINAAGGYLQKLADGGAGIKNEAFEDIINIAEVLYEASLDTVDDLKDSYRIGAEDLGANPEFVDRFFEKGFGAEEFEFDEEDEGELEGIFGTGETKTETSGSFKSGDKEFKLDFGEEGEDFNIGDQTSGTKVGTSNIGLGTITQDFGATSPLKIDNVKLADGSIGTPGIDIDGKIGDPIPSPVNGTVKSITKSDTGLGNRIVIVDEQGNEHYFNHLSKKNVKEGDTITAGQKIASMGNSGSVITGPGGDGSHLDYRVKSTQGWIDPNQFLNS